MNFESLKIDSKLVEILEKNDISTATEIQSSSIPAILNNRDVIGISKTGSGKTLAFCLPIINSLLKKNRIFHTLILTPTRELALQIKNILNLIGNEFGLSVALLVGGEDIKTQCMRLNRKAHVVVGTPGRVLDHMLNSKLKMLKLKFLVFDEADKLLSMDFEDDIKNILERINKDRQTLLFSATIDSKVENIISMGLRNPITVKSNSVFGTVDELIQKYVFVPLKYKPVYLYEFIKINKDKKIIIFVCTSFSTILLHRMLSELGFTTINLYGGMRQEKRNQNLKIFKEENVNILISTDILSRGIDIPSVHYVVNYDVPKSTDDYIHRVGRTARAGKCGEALTFVTQYEVEEFQKIEYYLDKRFEEYQVDEENFRKNNSMVDAAYKIAYKEAKDKKLKKKK